MDNTSGQGDKTVVPAEIKGWNWGAFLLNWVWGIGNATPIALLMFVPFVNLVMPFVLGAKGNTWAWRNKRWESVEQFRSTQRKWTIVGLILLAVGAVITLLSVLLVVGILAGMKNTDVYKLSVTRLEANAEAVAALGEPLSTGFPSGNVSTSASGGEASLSYSVEGSKAEGRVYLDAVKEGDNWRFDRLVLDLDGPDGRIDLNPEPDGQ